MSEVRSSENSLALPDWVTSQGPLDKAEAESIGGNAVQFWAAATAADASTSPNPYLRLYEYESVVDPYFSAPACQLESLLSFFCAVLARISFTSRHVKALLALRTSAATPDTTGAEKLVPRRLA